MVIGVSIGFAGGWYSGSRYGLLAPLNTSLLIYEEVGIGKMIDRFEVAYSDESTRVALWEGRNLLALLDESYRANETSVSESQSRGLQRSVLHAKMSILSEREGLIENAEQHAEKAYVCYKNAIQEERVPESREKEVMI